MGKYRGSSRFLIAHRVKPNLPQNAILDTMNGFCVCSPEFTFVQAAAICELPKLIEIGYELCGTYDLSEGRYRECAPLTTVERLTAFAGAADGVHGVRKARRALRCVAERSASPRETVLTMLLCLPYGFGGYGIEMPLLNHRVDVVGDALKMTSKKYCVCDLFWPKANLVIEYGGRSRTPGSSAYRKIRCAATRWRRWGTR